MKLYKPVIAALIATALFLFYRWDRERILEARIAEVHSTRIIPFDGRDAVRFELLNEEGRFVAERRGPEEWWLLEPVETRADEYEIENIIDSVHAAKKETRFAASNLDEYGLADPSFTLSMTGVVDGTTHEITLWIGDESPRAGMLYGRESRTDELFTIGYWVRNKLVRDLQSLRDRNLARFDPAGIESIELLDGDEDWTIERRDSNGETRWWIREADRPANQQLVNRVLGSLSVARASRIYDEEDALSPADTGLGVPHVNLRLNAADGSEHTVALGRAVPGEEMLYARSGNLPGIAAVRTSHVESLIAPRRADWGTRRMVWTDPQDFARVEAFGGETRVLALERDENDNWRFEDFPDASINPRDLRLFLGALSDLAATRFEEGGLDADELRERFGVRPEAYEVRVTDREGRVQGFKRGRLVGAEGIVYLQRLQDNTVWRVDAPRMEFVTFNHWRDLQDKRIHSGFAEDVASFVVETPPTETRYLVDRRNDVWRLRVEGVPPIVLNTQSVEDFLIAVEDIEWDSFEISSNGESEVPSQQTFRFLDEGGEELYRMEQIRSGQELVTLRTPQGVFNVSLRNSYLRMYSAWEAMLHTGELEDE